MKNFKLLLLSLLILTSASNYAQTVLLLKADAESASFVDSSIYNHESTATQVTKTTTEFVFGGQSMFFDGNSSLNFPDNSHWALSDNDFTIDMWLKRSGNLTGVQTPISQWHSSLGFSFIILHHANYHNPNEIGVWFNGQVIDQLKGTLSNNWTHIAVVRTNDVIRLYFDGQQVGSDYLLPNNWSVNNSAANLKIGNQQDGNEGHGWQGYIDEVRITKHAIDPNQFPPTESYCEVEADFNQDGVVDINDLLARQEELKKWIKSCWKPALNGEACM
ncbi:hypothetical protein C2869_18895 [Saccharobesus litoralis]|uniref:LamG-like jellyroll fold domain-containing protein n=1 Tax=Saccharobesus litoralis TaxID=2172099 RepID=A0A2S0VVW6_9ALTE|nr:LamG domain-containing protein [Saccharobesus litoralis]AWB68348.1 hypothetical protein C2869_18895 [Saccharobesus litoralis]